MRRDEAPVDGPVVIGLDQIGLLLEGISAPDSKAKLALKAAVGRGGSVEISGGLSLAPFTAALQVDVRAVPILPLQPYFSDKLHITLTRGTLNARGSVEVQGGAYPVAAGPGPGPGLAFARPIDRTGE